jgi:RNA polymerase sigma-54 factor
MKQVLQLRISQHLALTPQLQQSIRLLQLSTLELNQEIEQLLADNPLLERADDPFQGAMRLMSDGSMQNEAPRDASSGESATPTEAPAEEFSADNARGDEEAGGEWTGVERIRSSSGEEDEFSAPQLACLEITLREHLLEQLSVTQCGRRDRALVTMLIDALDDDGYLRQELEEIAELVPAELEIEADELRTALSLLQSFDPPGVGGRNAAECLALQLRASNGHADDNAATRLLARAIVADHLDLLAAHDFARLKRNLHCNDEALRAAQALIRSLDPFPGRRFGPEQANYVTPDVLVRKVKGQWRVMLNPDVMPRLHINRAYAQILRGQRGSEHGASLAARLQEARWLIKNVQQRFDTILRVSEAIVERQRNFFTHGEVAMRPLVLREIADTLGLHESTVSRVTTQKYMLTPLGTFELKYFFGSHVATEAGGAASSTAIRALIRQFIGAEDAKKPLSDSKIADMLGEQGIVVARRTIAKYREALRIPPVSLRKSL